MDLLLELLRNGVEVTIACFKFQLAQMVGQILSLFWL